jgi:hypothetical protein
MLFESFLCFAGPGTIVTNVSVSNAKILRKVPFSAETESVDDTPVRIPSNLKISGVRHDQM